MVVVILALVVFGPKKLPELGRSIGKGLHEFRGSMEGITGHGSTGHGDREQQPVLAAGGSETEDGTGDQKVEHQSGRVAERGDERG